MCGRYAFYLDPSKLKSFFGLENLLNLPPRYNCAPMQEHSVVVKNRMGSARWGFRPEWSKSDDPGMASKMINARSETVAEKPSFRESWARGRRCIIPANGFYEWKKNEDGTKQPYFIHHKDAEILCMAGLWSKVDDQVTFTVLTKASDGDIKDLHHRMPVMFEIGQVKDWFAASCDEAVNMIGVASGQQCDAYAVSNAVGKVANDSADLIAPLEAA
jgi:putative SOS response-associated peptidase YedK